MLKFSSCLLNLLVSFTLFVCCVVRGFHLSFCSSPSFNFFYLHLLIYLVFQLNFFCTLCCILLSPSLQRLVLSLSSFPLLIISLFMTSGVLSWLFLVLILWFFILIIFSIVPLQVPILVIVYVFPFPTLSSSILFIIPLPIMISGPTLYA